MGVGVFVCVCGGGFVDGVGAGVGRCVGGGGGGV